VQEEEEAREQAAGRGEAVPGLGPEGAGDQWGPVPVRGHPRWGSGRAGG